MLSVKSGEERYISGCSILALRVRINDKSKCGEKGSRWIRCTHDKREREGEKREIQPDISRITLS